MFLLGAKLWKYLELTLSSLNDSTPYNYVFPNQDLVTLSCSPAIISSNIEYHYTVIVLQVPTVLFHRLTQIGTISCRANKINCSVPGSFTTHVFIYSSALC